MLYLSGCVRPDLLGREDVGIMITPHMGNRPDLSNTPWAADTGCFKHPERFDLIAYEEWLSVTMGAYRATCLFATAPDRVGDPEATLRVAAQALLVLREIGYRPALVAQPGLVPKRVPWDYIDALFIGGGRTAWMFSSAAHALVIEARERGKWVHMGRVNSRKRLVQAQAFGAHSSDGTYLAFGPDVNTPKMERWIAHTRRAPTLVME